MITELRNRGYHPEPMSAADMADGELDFDEFSAWFLKQVRFKVNRRSFEAI